MAEENRKLIGLSFTGCVRQIALGLVREDQVVEIIAGTALKYASVLRREFEQKVKSAEDGLERRTEELRREKVRNPDLVAFGEAVGKREVTAVYDGSATWEGVIAHYKSGPEWKGNNEDLCEEIAWRLLKADKVRQPRLEGGQAPSCGSGIWVDAVTKGPVRIVEPFDRLSKREPAATERG